MKFLISSTVFDAARDTSVRSAKDSSLERLEKGIH